MDDVFPWWETWTSFISIVVTVKIKWAIAEIDIEGSLTADKFDRVYFEL